MSNPFLSASKKLALLCAALVCATAARAAPVFVNGLTLPGNMGDRFGTSVNDGRLGYFSDLYYDPTRGEWWALSDRGPGGGTLSYETRLHRFTIDVDPILVEQLLLNLLK